MKHFEALPKTLNQDYGLKGYLKKNHICIIVEPVKNRYLIQKKNLI